MGQFGWDKITWPLGQNRLAENGPLKKSWDRMAGCADFSLFSPLLLLFFLLFLPLGATWIVIRPTANRERHEERRTVGGLAQIPNEFRIGHGPFLPDAHFPHEPLKGLPCGLKLCNPSIQSFNPRLREATSSRAILPGIEMKELPDLFEGESRLLSLPDELQTPEVLLWA